jgi:potassium-dependent mechanosensitive channel
MKKTLFHALIILFFVGHAGFSQIVKHIPAAPPDTPQNIQKPIISAQWYNDILDELNTLYEIDQTAPDTNILKKIILVNAEKTKLFQREFSTMPGGLSIRYLYDLKMEISRLLDKLENSRRTITSYFKSLTRKRITFNQAKRDIFEFLEITDSSISRLFNRESTFLLNQIDEGLAFVNSRLDSYTKFKDDLLVITNQAYQLQSDVNKELSLRESQLFRKELPPIWKSGPSTYNDSFIPTMNKTFRRSFETFRSYIESSFVNAIAFRILLYVLFLLPIFIYYRNSVRLLRPKKAIDPEFGDPEIHYFENHPVTVSVILGLAFSPAIFVNAPHSFLELIFLGLVFAVCIFAFKNYPKVDKNLILMIFLPYIILYLFNFFVTPTFLSRIIWSFCILLLIPLFLLLKKLRRFDLRYEKFIRFLVIFLMMHIPIGWLWIVVGRYALGKSVILAAYNVLILSIILRIAMFSFLEYLAIVSSMINKRFESIHINYQQLARAIRPFLHLIVFIVLVVGYLTNLNLWESSSQRFVNFLEQPRTINNVEFNYKSVVLFLASVYLAFLISNILRAAFAQMPDHGSASNKSKFGSYIILIRLLVMTAGFLIAVMISGIPLSTFTIIFGALSLGIGFGLQSMVSNIFSGLFIAFERPFIVGDLIEYGKDSGRVKEIGLRATRIMTPDGADVLIPNGALLSNNIKNWTYSNNYRALEIAIPVDHGEDHMKIQSLISEALQDQPGLVNKSNIPIALSEITENATVYKTTITVDNMSNAPNIKGEFMNRLYTLFRDNDVRLPQSNSKD